MPKWHILETILYRLWYIFDMQIMKLGRKSTLVLKDKLGRNSTPVLNGDRCAISAKKGPMYQIGIYREQTWKGMLH